jgi:uncharacterized protein YcbK (DUF882 family)
MDGFTSKGLRGIAKNKFLFSICRLTAAAAALVAATAGTQDAVANGDTRSLTFFHTHTKETATITFRQNGQYDDQALAQLNWLLRDWRVDEKAKMDPRLFDIIWEVYREVGSREPIHVISAYRSPATNGMLRRRSRAVSEHSQHMGGKAMDIRMPDVDTGRLRAVAMRMQYGGVGYYPSSEFVHVDTGSVRAWPRMSQEQLVRLFPDGKTLHLPSNGKPLSGYEEAKAEILTRNASLAVQASAGGGGSLGSLMANLFGRGKQAAQAPQAERPTEAVAPVQVAYAQPEDLEQALTFAPLPPRRPKDTPALLTGDAPPPVPNGPTIVASVPLRNDPPQPEAHLGYDEKAAVRALFDARTAVLGLEFSSHPTEDLNITHFSGPAVKPLPDLRQASAAP